MLEFIVNLYKIILSYYFVAATYLLYKRKNNSVYPIYITYFLNALVLIILAATLDHRFIYPLVSIYFIIIAYGICEYRPDRKSTRLNSSHVAISYAVFCLKKKN